MLLEEEAVVALRFALALDNSIFSFSKYFWPVSNWSLWLFGMNKSRYMRCVHSGYESPVTTIRAVNRLPNILFTGEINHCNYVGANDIALCACDIASRPPSPALRLTSYRR